MSIETRLQNEGKTLVVSISGRLDYTEGERFFRAYENLDTEPIRFEIDMSSCQFIDSSGLGMLLVMREHVGEDAEVVIRNCQPEVRRILDIAKFQRLFSLE